jgi:preprotein translocase subunit SecA
MFERLTSSIKSQVASLIFKVSFMEQPKAVQMEERRPDITGESHRHQPVINEPAHRQSSKDSAPPVGRNDLCPCGSGKKYKKCGLLNTPEHQKLMSRK